MASRRRIAASLLGLVLTMGDASAALAHGGGAAPGEGIFSADSVLLALITSFLTGVICYTLMVWDPKRARKEAPVPTPTNEPRGG